MTDAVASAQQDAAEFKQSAQPLNDASLDLIFRRARTYNGWQERDVTDEQLQQIFKLMKMGPTSANSNPARLIFIRGEEAKSRLKPALFPGNMDKTMSAPVTVIIGYDTKFYEHLPRLFPHKDMTAPFRENAAHAETTAFRNSAIQGAYLIIAARALGLDTGAVSGFDNGKVDAEFFAGSTVKSNFLCNLGYGEPESLFGRSPRFDFDEVCKIL